MMYRTLRTPLVIAAVTFPITESLLTEALLFHETPLTNSVYAQEQAGKPNAAENVSENVAELARQLTTGKLEERRDAAYELAALGSGALSAREALVSALDDKDEQIWIQSATAVGRIGPAAVEAVPALIRNLDQYNIQRRYRAAWALGQIGEPALPMLQEALKSHQDRVRAGVYEAYGWMTALSPQVLPQLILGLEDRDGTVRRYAVLSLEKLGQPAEQGLAQGLANDQAEVREIAARGFGQLQDLSESSQSLLLATTKDSSAKTRAAALLSLSATNLNKEQRLAAILEALQDDENPTNPAETEIVQGGAVLALKQMREDASGAVPHLIQMLESDQKNRRTAAAFTLGSMGSAAEAAVPFLISGLKRDEDHSERLQALSRIGVKAVPALLEAAADPAQSPQHLAVALAGIGPVATPQLIKSLQHPQTKIQASAAYALASMERTPGEASEGLRSCLNSESAEVRRGVVTALGNYLTVDDETLSLLSSRGADPDPGVRAGVLDALTKFSKSEDQLVPLISQALRDESFLVRSRGIKNLKELSSLHTSFRTELESALSDPDAAVRNSAAETLGGMGEAAKESVPKLLLLLNDESAAVRKATAVALGEIGLKTSEVATALIARLEDDDRDVLFAAVESLTVLGEVAQDAITAITKLLQHEKAEIRGAAVRCYSAIEQNPSQAVQTLIEVVKDEDWTVRRDAIAGLGKLGGQAKSAVPVLFPLLDSDEDTDVARGALQAIDTAGRDALPVLLEGLESGNRRKSFYAIFLIGKIGPEAQSALPTLRKMLAESDSKRLQESLQKTIDQIAAPPAGTP